MNTVCPDRWVIIKITHKGDEPTYKVVATFYGGYARGDSWRASSGICGIEEDSDLYTFKNHSGSSYVCFKERYGASMYVHSIIYSWMQELNSKGDTLMEILPQDDIPFLVEEFKIKNEDQSK